MQFYKPLCPPPWQSHRTMAEVFETEGLEKIVAKYKKLTPDESAKLLRLAKLEEANNPELVKNDDVDGGSAADD